MSDPASTTVTPGTGTDLGLVPFVSGSTVSSTAQSPNSFVTYNTTSGVQLIPFTNATYVVQAGTRRGLLRGDARPEREPVRHRVQRHRRRLGEHDRQRPGHHRHPNADRQRAASSSVTVTSGTVVTGGNLTLTGAVLNFGAATGYIHLGGQLTVGNTATPNLSQITGSGGVVISGAPGTLTYYIAQFSNSNVGNPFTGGLTVNDATVQYTDDGELGASGGSVTLDGGFLVYNANPSTAVTLGRPIRLAAAGGGHRRCRRDDDRHRQRPRVRAG